MLCFDGTHMQLRLIKIERVSVHIYSTVPNAICATFYKKNTVHICSSLVFLRSVLKVTYAPMPNCLVLLPYKTQLKSSP